MRQVKNLEEAKSLSARASPELAEGHDEALGWLSRECSRCIDSAPARRLVAAGSRRQVRFHCLRLAAWHPVVVGVDETTVGAEPASNGSRKTGWTTPQVAYEL